MPGKILTPYSPRIAPGPPPKPVTLKEALQLASEALQYIRNDERIPDTFPREKLEWAIHQLWSASLMLALAEKQITSEGSKNE